MATASEYRCCAIIALSASNCLRSSRGFPRRDDCTVSRDGADVGDDRGIKR
jgi:hypothetical protein